MSAEVGRNTVLERDIAVRCEFGGGEDRRRPIDCQPPKWEGESKDVQRSLRFSL